MAKKAMHLVFPPRLIKEPVIYTMAKKFNLIPNIRRAKVTETVGEVTLCLSGTKQDLEKAQEYLEKTGIRVESVTGDIVE